MLTVDDIRKGLRVEALQPRRHAGVHKQLQERIPRMMVELREACHQHKH
jgi:hypothetical protein